MKEGGKEGGVGEGRASKLIRFENQGTFANTYRKGSGLKKGHYKTNNITAMK